MTPRLAAGRGLFYHRDSAGHSDLAPPRYVAWAAGEAARLGVGFAGTPDQITEMIARRSSADGDVYLDYGVSGNRLSRPGFDAFRRRALGDPAVSHLFVWHRDRIARPDDATDAMAIETQLRKAGLTFVFATGVTLPPLALGARAELGDLLMSAIDYHESGKFREKLAAKLVEAKVGLAAGGFSIGGEPPYGFRRWLCAPDGTPVREVPEREVVKAPGHHVAWLPTAEEELRTVARIRRDLLTTPATRVARRLSDEGVPSPKAGRLRVVRGVKVPNSGLWTANTVTNLATHLLYAGIAAYGRRAEGDQRRLTATGPRPLTADDYGADGRPRRVAHPDGAAITVPARCEAQVTAADRAELARVLGRRGVHLKGKARARGAAVNPLGGRVYDLGCGWPMYRNAKRGGWCYSCGLYANTGGKCCSRNAVAGEAATRFVLAAIGQRLSRPDLVGRVRIRLAELLAAEAGRDGLGEERAAAGRALAEARDRRAASGTNMALANSPEKFEVISKVFEAAGLEVARLEARLHALPAAAAADLPAEVESAMATLSGLRALASDATPEGPAAAELIRALDARLYLKFATTQKGRRTESVPSGGVLTFGSTPPPVPLYEGKTDRAIVRHMLTKGEPVSAGLGSGSPTSSQASAEVQWSGNVQRVTRRCSRPGPHVRFSRVIVAPAAPAAELSRSAAQVRNLGVGSCYGGSEDRLFTTMYEGCHAILHPRPVRRVRRRRRPDAGG